MAEKALKIVFRLVYTDATDGMAIAVKRAFEKSSKTFSDCGVVVFLFGTFVGVSDICNNFKVGVLEIYTCIYTFRKGIQALDCGDCIGVFLGTITIAPYIGN